MSGFWTPSDVAEAASLERDRELDLPRRHRLEVEREIMSERTAIANIEASIGRERVVLVHSCRHCNAVADLVCAGCEEHVCVDDAVDGVCVECLGLLHGERARLRGPR